MEILNLLGLNKTLFIFQLINFLIIAYILKRFLFKPLMKMIDERKRRVEQSLQDAEDARIVLENAGEERKKIIAEAKNDADALTLSSKASIEETRVKMTEDAKQRSSQIIEDAKQKAAMEFENMNKQIGQMSLEISEKVMTKVFSELFTEEEKKALMSRALEKIEKGGYEKSSN